MEKFEARFENMAILSQAKEVRETTDMEEAVQLLSSGKWIAVFAAPSKQKIKFCLLRVG